MGTEYQPGTEDSFYFAVSPLMMFPSTKGEFGIYLKINGRFMLYAHPDEPFSTDHLERLHQNGVQEVYVHTKQRAKFETYLEDHLGNFLMNDDLPFQERSRVFYSASVDVMQDTFKSRLPGTLPRERFQKIAKFVRAGTKYLLKDKSFKSMASFISHDYYTWSHCVHVFVFSQALLHTYHIDGNQLFYCGLGAILHDLGKVAVDRSILEKPGLLSPEEREIMKAHPLKGVALCSTLPLNQDAINCILFHHEKMNGTGYPTGLCGEEMPLAVRVISVCDVYAALTTDRPYAKAKTPYEALSLMKDGMKGHFDEEVYTRFVKVLSGADIV